MFAVFHLVESSAHWTNYFAAEREDRIEFWETTMFFLAGLIFMVGSFFYWPGLYDWWHEGETEHAIHEAEEFGEALGAYLFVTGSVLFLIASMFNAIGLGMNKEEKEKNPISVKTHYIHLCGLTCSQLGSVLFVAGSFMYRPAIGSPCPDYTARYEGAAQASEPVAAHACETTGSFGTHLYIYGSILYSIEAILGFVNSILKGAYANDEKCGHKEVVSDEDETGTELIENQS